MRRAASATLLLRLAAACDNAVTVPAAIDGNQLDLRFRRDESLLGQGLAYAMCHRLRTPKGCEGLCAALDPAAAGLQEPKWGCMEVEGPTMRCLPAEGRSGWTRRPQRRRGRPQRLGGGPSGVASDNRRSSCVAMVTD